MKFKLLPKLSTYCQKTGRGGDTKPLEKKRKYITGDAFLNHKVVRKEIEWGMGKNEDPWDAGGNTKVGKLEMLQGIDRSRYSLLLNLAAKNSECKN